MKPASISAWLVRRGFDPARMIFALRTAIACGLALVAAWAMGLEHPQWAGMSVWAASQPLRGQLLEKSFYRFSGTVCGTGVGILLVLAMRTDAALMIVGLALWIAACTWLANLQRGLLAYGTVLAGYSASMVALLDTAHPEHVWLLAGDRLATVLTGVVVATAAGYYFSRPAPSATLRSSVLRLLADALRHQAGASKEGKDADALLASMAAVEEGLEPHAAGSLRSRRVVRATRAVLLAIVPLLLRRPDTVPRHRDALNAAAGALDRADVAAARAALADIGISAPVNSALLDWEAASFAPQAEVREASPATALHRDWIGAREAALRAGGALLLFGAVWLITGWSVGAYMLLGLSVMISLFSTFENPILMMRHVALGQLIGAVAAIICQQLLWPHAGSELSQILMLMPFVLASVGLAGHRRTFLAAMDYSMVFLLLSQPAVPMLRDLSQQLVMGLAVISAPLVAWACYLIVFPITLHRRQQHLVQMMLHDLEALARKPDSLAHRAAWQARFFHRALRLVRLSDRLPGTQAQARTISRATLALAHCAMHCHAVLASADATPRERKFIEQARARIARIGSNPGRSVNALARLAVQVPAQNAELFEDAARAAADLVEATAAR